jgi:periplasmic protein TonB
VRCVGCEIDKSAESDYCECCGRRLSLSAMLRKGPGVFTTRQARDPERPNGRGVERTAVRELEGAPAAERNPALDGRCETCGGESPDGGLCPSCQQAFNAWLGNVETSTLSNAAAPCVAAATDDAAVASDAATVASEPTAVDDTTWVSSVTAASAATAVSEAPSAPEATPVEESLWSQLMNSPAPPPDDELYMPDPVEKAPARHKASSTSAVGVTATQTEAVSDELRSEVAPMEAMAPEPVRTSEAVRTEEPTPPVAIPVDMRIESTLPVNAPSPGVDQPRPTAPSSSQPKRHSVSLAAAAVVVAALWVGAYWVRNQTPPAAITAREEQQAPVAASGVTAVAKRQPTAPTSPAEQTQNRKASASPTPARTKPTTVVAPAKDVRSSTLSTRQVAAAPAPEPVLEPPAPVVVAPSAPEVVVSTPPPAAPSGQFFETTDVGESPQVTKRVEPQLPDELRNHPLNEILVVRVLVSQSGHPYRISLLRKSKTGPQLDKAVIAAVNQWKFTPAKRRGEAVSCWMNLGVPVSAS